MDNLDMFKTQKKCFQSLNWRPPSKKGKYQKLQKQVEEQQKLKHFLNVKQRREEIEKESQNKLDAKIQKHAERLQNYEQSKKDAKEDKK